MTISKIFVPSLVGLVVYVTVNRFFPEKVDTKIELLEPDPVQGLRGGDSLTRMRLIQAITKQILKERALKIALVSVFAAAGIQHFQAEIESLLIADIFKRLSESGAAVDIDGQLKVVYDIVQEHDLTQHAKSIRQLLVSQTLTREQKISLLKIKLDWIINGECSGRKRFFIMLILGALLAITFSGIGGLALILEALYQLFKEGKISEALYKQILQALRKKFGAVPAEFLIDD